MTIEEKNKLCEMLRRFANFNIDDFASRFEADIKFSALQQEAASLLEEAGYL